MPGSRGVTVLDDLPESIIVWEILIWLPPRDALRCRAVRKSWRSSTSARDFLLEHHRHQPSLPVIRQYADTKYGPGVDAFHDPRLVVFHDTGAGDQKLWPVLRYATPPEDYASLRFYLHDCRDGLLIVSNTVGSGHRQRFFYVCNPATHRCAPLPQLAENCWQLFTTSIAGLYLHHTSGEYRVLYFCWSGRQKSNADFYITTIGSEEPRKFIGQPPPSPSPSVEQALLKGLLGSIKTAPILHRGGLHWELGRYHQHYTVMCDIMVFDTTVETFRWLVRPAQAPLGLSTVLLEMGGALALFSARDGMVIDVFVLQDYENEVWALHQRIDLSTTMAELPQLELTVVLVNERELLIELPGRLLHCDIDGKVLEIMEYNRPAYTIQMTTYLLQESIVPLPLFETQQGRGANNDSPFFLGF